MYKNIHKQYMKDMKKKLYYIISILIITVICFFIDILVGSNQLEFKEVIHSLITYSNDVPSFIVWNIRIPMSLMAMIVGGILAISGAQMQTILNNPLADPYTFGISSAASLGASLVITGLININYIPQEYQIPLISFLFSSFTIVLISGISIIPSISIKSILLLGIALMFCFDALVIFIQYIADESQLQSIIFFKMGSLARSSWEKIVIIYGASIIILPIIMMDVWPLTLLKLDTISLFSMGINPNFLKIKHLLFVSLLTSLSVSFVGSIGFIGIVAPHIARLLIGEDKRFFLPLSFFIGAIITILASIVSKLIIPGLILPITVITSIIGVPFFVFLIIRQRS